MINDDFLYSAGVRISQILYTMSQYDERFHPLVTVIKTWGRASGVTQSTPFEGFSSFMLNMLVMHFLQTREHPVLPAIKDMYRPDGRSFLYTVNLFNFTSHLFS